jgi:hypothetical protein
MLDALGPPVFSLAVWSRDVQMYKMAVSGVALCGCAKGRTRLGVFGRKVLRIA